MGLKVLNVPLLPQGFLQRGKGIPFLIAPTVSATAVKNTPDCLSLVGVDCEADSHKDADMTLHNLRSRF